MLSSYTTEMFWILPFTCMLFLQGCDRLFQTKPLVPQQRFDYVEPNPLALADQSIAQQPRGALDFPALRGLEAEIKLLMPWTTTAEIFMAIKTAVADYQVETNIPAAELHCMRDYSLPCPERWVDVGDGETCAAADGYVVTSGCGKEESVAKMTVTDKRAFAQKCNVQWPCYNACVEDFTLPCPLNWQLGWDRLCRANPWYTGDCLAVYDFKYHGAYLKYKWSRICKVTWPCRDQQAGLDIEVKLMPPRNESMRIKRIDYPSVS